MEESNVQSTPNAPVQVTPPSDKKGLAITSLVLGIVSLAFSFCAMFAWITIPCGILGIIFGALSRKGSAKGMAIAGLICSVIGIAIVILALTIFAGTMASLSDTLNK